MWSTSSLPLLPGPLLPGMIVPVRVQSMGQIESFTIIETINTVKKYQIEYLYYLAMLEII